MPLHLIQHSYDTKANIEAIGAANNACVGQWYMTNDTGEYYYGLPDRSLAGPLLLGEANYPGPYKNHDVAAAEGVLPNQVYELSDDNDWNVPGGTLIRRK
jgi:hypothetical protein